MDERMHEVLQYVVSVDADATKKKRLLAQSLSNPEYQYEQGRADVARMVAAIIGQRELVDRYGDVLYHPGGSESKDAWPAERRLRTIAKFASAAIQASHAFTPGVIGRLLSELERITYLASMPATFLEANKANLAEAPAVSIAPDA